MTPRTTANRLIAVALLLVAVYLVLSIAHIFKGQPGWVEYCIIGVACVLIFIAAFLRIRHRSERQREIRSSRDSLLKHLWELRHKREW